jgi:hypothetical protein
MNFAAVAAALTQSAFRPAQCQLFPPAPQEFSQRNNRIRARVRYAVANAQT